MDTILECKNLTKRYGSFTALSSLNLSLEKGQIIGLLGPNGSGKTTLIKCMNGLLAPTSGEIRVGCYHPGVESKRILSYLPERNALPDWMKVRDLVRYFQDFYADFRTEKAFAMLKDLKIDIHKRLKNLSKGTKEKVQLILAMSREADLYCLDEPIGGVDPASRDYILKTILNNYSENAAVIISTHLIQDIEAVLDRVLFLQDGELRLNAAVDEIREQKGMSVDTLFREVFKC